MASLNKEISCKIKTNQSNWSREIMEYQYKIQPELKEKYTPAQKEHFLQDIKYHLTYLAETILLDSKSLFTDYISWSQILLSNLGVPMRDLINNLDCIKEVMVGKLAEKEAKMIKEYIEAGKRELKEPKEEISSFLTEDNPLLELSKDYLDTLLNGSRQEASRLIMEAVEKKVPIKDIYLHVFQPVQREIGRLWQLNQLSVAREHYCTSVTQLIMSQLYPYILNTESRECTCVTTCVGEELHELGIRMIADLMELEGWNTIHLGANTPLQGIVREVMDRKADLLGISVTMTSHLEKVAELIEAVNSKIGQDVKVMVGGYPFNINQNLWKEVGADGYAPDAVEALKVAKELCCRGSD